MVAESPGALSIELPALSPGARAGGECRRAGGDDGGET